MTFLALVLLVGVAFYAFVLWQKRKGSSLEPSVYKSKPLLSDNEREFFLRLSQALPNCHIFTQVALGALLQPNVRNNSSAYYRTRATFSQKIADYVICDREMNVLAVVELDDRTHSTDKDAKRDAMLVQAGYKVVRWNSKSKPSIEQIRERVGAIESTPANLGASL